MLMPAERIYQVIEREFAKVCEAIPDSQMDGSSAQAISVALKLLRERELRGGDALREQFRRLRQVLESVEAETGSSAEAASTEIRRLGELLQITADPVSLHQLEERWREAMSVAEELANRLLVQRNIDGRVKEQIAKLLVEFESADLMNQLGPEVDTTGDSGTIAITRSNLAAYLRDRFGDPDLEVTSLKPLSGGFGKETIVFTTEGKSLEGEFVMRRDIGSDAALENDCHRIEKEYHVIKAVREHGYLSPDVLWLDTEHSLLPGGQFIIMRRSPGHIGGNFFGAQSEIPETLVDILAKHTADLHNLPPLEELGDLTESITRRQWELSKKENIETYLRGWYDYWRSEAHSASPAIVSLYGWLFDNLPDREGPPTIVHGDIGFHNILVEGDELSVILDWEFAHVGDPAEDLGYVKVTTGGALDWDRFMERYLAAGGEPVDDRTLHFFQVWAYVRNACAANVISNRFVTGRADELKLSALPHIHVPHFLRNAQALIEKGF